MKAAPPTFTRRQVAAGIGAALTALPARSDAHAQERTDALGDAQVLRARNGMARLHGATGPQTAIAGFGGMTPGPLLRVKRGEDLRVRLVNELAEPTAIHWHGLRIPAAMGGIPGLSRPPVGAGSYFDYRFAPPDAGTYWYHAPFVSSPLQQRGLYGALIVEEAAPVAVDRDVPLVIVAWPGGGGTATSSPFLTVNGTPSVDVAARTNERIRLRLINAAAIVMPLRIEGHRADVMAIDGQPAEPFPARDGFVVLGPGSRIDLFIDATEKPGTRAVLLSSPLTQAPLAHMVYDGGSPARGNPRPPADPLPANALPQRIDLASAVRTELRLGETSPLWRAAADATFQPADKPVFTIASGRAAVVALNNTGSQTCVFYVQGHPFRLLDRLDDGWKPFWLDTVVVPAGQTVRIALVAGESGRWLLHRFVPEQPGSGSAAWFAVV